MKRFTSNSTTYLTEEEFDEYLQELLERAKTNAKVKAEVVPTVELLYACDTLDVNKSRENREVKYKVSSKVTSHEYGYKDVAEKEYGKEAAYLKDMLKRYNVQASVVNDKLLQFNGTYRNMIKLLTEIEEYYYKYDLTFEKPNV